MWNDGGGFGGGGYQSMDTSYGGGGYMQDTQFNSPTAASQEKKPNANKNQGMIPCTIKQLHAATYDQANDTFKLPHADLAQVSFVGVIRQANEAATNIIYHVNDMTGDDILVKKWINESEESEEERQRRSACRENSYVKVTGNLKTFKENSRSIVAFNVSPVTDFNQITHHMLEVMFAHLYLQKNPANNNGVGMTPAKGTFQGGMMTTPGRNDNSFDGGNSLGLSGLQLQVHNIIATATSEEGMSLVTIRQKLRPVSDNAIKNAIEFLSNEGHIYSTTDDEHFKSTDSG